MLIQLAKSYLITTKAMDLIFTLLKFALYQGILFLPTAAAPVLASLELNFALRCALFLSPLGDR